MAFQPRTTCPSSTDKCWISTGYGGYNKCILGKPSYGRGSVLANCVGYVWGRFLEIMRQADPSITTCDLPTCNAGDFIARNNKYDAGNVAKVGAIAVFAPNHVAVVEKIDSNGVCTLSESGWGGPTFHYGNTISKAKGYNDHDWGKYTIKGFIYNPYGGAAGQDIATVFVNEALKHVGEHASDWTWRTYGMFNIEWCAAFVSAVAKTIGIAGKCIVSSASASGIVRESVRSNMGTFYKGPGQGGVHTPAVGDLVQFRHGVDDEYSCGHVGIVVEVRGNQFDTVEGNTGSNNKYTSVVKRKSYSVSATNISGYYHPNWSIVGGLDPVQSVVTGDLYTTQTTREDLTVREIGFLDDDLKPSIRSSPIKLSVINYTGVLSAAFKLVAPVSISSGGGSANTDKLEGNCKIVVDYMMSKGLNAAAACGIAGNIEHESGFRTDAVGDGGTSFGICQWHNERGSAMKRVAGSNWSTNLTGQLDYLWQELNSGYKSSTLSPLQSVPNTADGCRRAADVFVRKFEVPSDVDRKSLERQATASAYFSKVVVLSTSPITPGADAANLRTQSGQLATVVRTIEIPSNVPQTGIIRNYTNYSQFYGRWSKGTIQRTLSELWGQQGKPKSRNIATINGYYLLAMTSTFATTGDIVTIELANGDRINAILGDSKGRDAGSIWGHLLSGKSDIVEWEAVGNGQQGATRIELGSWEGQRVVRVYNRGTFLR